MKKVIFCIFFCCLIPFTGFSQIPLPKVWLKADSLNGSNRSIWPDNSINRNNAKFSKDTLRLMKGVLNYNPAVYFDSSGKYFKIPYYGMSITPALTIMSVFYSADTTERGLWGVNNICPRKAGQTTRRALGPDSLFDPYLKSEKQAVLNRLIQQWLPTTIAPDTNSAMLLGSFALNQDSIAPFKGYLAEYLVFDHILEATEQAQAETYLAIKYGIHLQKGNYVSSDKKILWNRKSDSLYSNRITGIGRDDYFKLYQKQSSSASENFFLSIGTGNIVKTNKENKSAFSDKNFLIWGDNGNNLAPSSNTTSLITSIQRKWKMKATGTGAKYISTQLKLNKNLLIQHDSVYILIIDRSGTGDFSKADYFPNDTIVDDSIVVFNNIHWDTDGSGSDVFNFGTSGIMNLTASVQRHPLCPYSDEGTVKLKTIGGHSPFQYSVISKGNSDTLMHWSVNTDSIIKSGFKRGAQEILVKDAVGLTAKVFIQLFSSDSIHIDLGEDRVLRNHAVYTMDVSQQVPDSMKQKVTYHWEGSLGYSSTSPSATLSEPDLYTLAVTTDSGCVYKDQILLTDSPLLKFEINPSLISEGGKANIHLLFNEPTDIQLSMISADGKEYWSKKETGKRSYNFSEIIQDEGIYYVILKTSSCFEVKKIIVVK